MPIGMQSIDKKVARTLSLQYIAALSIVAILTVFGHTLIQFSLSEASDNSHVINLSGRQRMLSQKLTKLVLLKSNTNHAWSALDQKEFETGLRNWVSTHEGLQWNKLEDDQKYSVKNSPSIIALFGNLSPYFGQMKSDFDRVAEGEIPSQDMVERILKNEKLFLGIMDNIVFEYDHEATKKIERLRAFEYLILFLTFLTLLIEFFFIFKPLSNYVIRVIQRLSFSERRLQEANNQLSLSNKMLRNTQNDLAIATQEKYELKRKEDQIRSVSLLEGQEEERKRLSREIHDGIGQMLTGIKLGVSKLKAPASEGVRERSFEHLNGLINETIETTRTVSFNLMPTVLNDFGVASAIKILLKKAPENSHLNIICEFLKPETRYSANHEITVYRIIQEAYNNVLKHAQATELKVSMHDRKGQMVLTITDNGVGFDPEQLQSKRQSLIHNGLENIKTRVDLLGGTFKLTSIPGEGTDIFITLPID